MAGAAAPAGAADRKRWKADVIHQKQAFVPRCLGFGAFGTPNPPLVAANTQLQRADGFALHAAAWQVLRFSGNAAPARECTVSAHRLCVTLSCELAGAAALAGDAFLKAFFGSPRSDGPLVTPLGGLMHKVPWTAQGGYSYEPARERLVAILSLLDFRGDLHPAANAVPLPRPAHNANAQTFKDACVGAQLAVRDCGGQRTWALELLVYVRWRYAWQSATYPDGLISTSGAAGNAEERLLQERVAVVYTLSKGQGKSADARAATLEVLACGVLLCLARRAHAQRLAQANPVGPATGAGPIMVVGVPPGWAEMTRGQDAAAKHSARAWRFAWREPAGICVWRSCKLRVAECLDFVHDYLR